MDAKISCLVKGLIGIIFGGLAITVPDPTLAIFSALFGVIIVAGLIICIFLAITSHSEGSLFWFLASTVLLIIGIVSFIIPDLVTILFVIVIAALAFYSALSGISLALTRPRLKHYLIAGAFIVAGLLCALLLWYVPVTREELILTVLGVFSLVFGIFSIFMGWYLKEEPASPPPVHMSKTCTPPKGKDQ